MDVVEVTAGTDDPAGPVLHEARNGPVLEQCRQPPRGGLPLGAVLGATITALLASLLGGLTAFQLHREEHAEISARQGLLAEVVAPLAAEIERAGDLAEIERLLSSTVRAETARGRSDFRLMLCDQEGRPVVSVPRETDALPLGNAVRAQVPVLSALLGSGHGTLTVSQRDAWLIAEMVKRRRAAWLDIGVTVLAVSLVVQLMIYLLVSLPLNHLLTAFEKVEQGYPAKPHQGASARELRWLEWRFHHMNISLINSARLLVAAHRRAMDVSRSRPRSGVNPQLLDPLDLGRSRQSAGHEIMRRYLVDRCALLERHRHGDPRAREVARQVWERDAVEAEKLGEMGLRARAENAALRILDPDAFERVNRELDTLVAARAEWCAATSETIESTLATDGVSPVAIQRRAKHAAGIWRKMGERKLDLEDVADILAFRIIVPGLDACYLSLDTVHRLFEPEPFRFKDYIAEPKANGYQSLHTSVRGRDGFVFEVQIRTVEMHREAEEGNAAHWRYRASKARRP